jgi:TrmH family RNA methyltransferase
LSEQPADPLSRVVFVLWNTQNIVNIAGTIRAMKNFGLHRLRLVAPLEWDPGRIEGIAHDTEDIVARTQIFQTLEQALADCSYTLGMTARERRAKTFSGRPRQVAGEILERASGPDTGPVALLFGREDIGLPNEALDMCHRTVTIPTNPEHPSLNLAQAVLVIAYEIWMAHDGGDRPFKLPRRVAPAANVHLLERTFEDVERALWAIDFFKNRQTESVMRTLRQVAHRAELDQREASFLRAIAIEVVKYIDRHGSADPGRSE